MSGRFHIVRSTKSRGARGTPEEEAAIDARLRALCELASAPMTARAIAREIGLSHSGVSHVEQRAIRKIRAALARDGIHSLEQIAI